MTKVEGQHNKNNIAAKSENIEETHAKERVSVQLRNVRLVDENNLDQISKLSKTFNSISRCSFKRFKENGIGSMLRFHKKPEKRPFNFKNCPIIDGKPQEYECPIGMSREMWIRMRKESYMRKMKPANPFWQIDKDLGSPIAGTIQYVGDWARKKGYDIDYAILHNAVMEGLRIYKSFDKQERNYKSSKKNPVFGRIEERSRKKITKDEFQLSKNSSMTIIGKKVIGGNTKFKFDSENDIMSFVFGRKRIEFSFESHRFSKKGYRSFSELVKYMNEGKIPVTVTLTMLGGNKFNVTLTYSPYELSKIKNENSIKDGKNNSVKCALYCTDEALCQQIVNVSKNKIIFSRIWRIDKITEEKKINKIKSELEWKKDFKSASKLEKKLANKTEAISSEILSKAFKINKAYGVSEVIVESPKGRTARNFNNSYIEFHKDKIGKTSRTCYISAPRFVDKVKSKCSMFGMKLTKKSNGAFAQMVAVMKSTSMEAALKNVTVQLLENNTRSYRPTEYAKWMSNPSMLDWIRHLLHNKRTRQARKEIRKTFHLDTVERAVRLIDTRTFKSHHD